ncbi:MAG: hypothetical protein CSA81_07425 [Acidobacteria bacterium]|nr:MAG: hypothetical protein CSA81_07425 [Acidobacteriota bacterium]
MRYSPLTVLAVLGFALSLTGYSQELTRIDIPFGKELSHGYFTYKKNLHIEGGIEGDVFCLGGRTTVTGRIEGNIIMVSGTLEVAPEAKITGKIITIGSPFIGPKSISGWYDISMKDTYYPEHLTTLESLKRCIFRVMFVFLFGSLLICLKPKNIRTAGLEIRTDWIPTFFVGSFLAIAFILSLFGALFFFSEPIGPILFVVLSCVMTLTALFGLVAVYEAIAYNLKKHIMKKWGFVHAFLAAVLLCEFLFMLPILGPVIQLIAFIFAVGTTLTTRFGTNKGWFTQSKKVWSA